MSSPQAPKENKMGVMPVNKLLLSMSIPMMLSMLVQALYNVVDSVFVSRISEDALNAVSLAFPIQNLMIAVSVGTGVGINAQLSRYLGSKDQKRADATAVNGLFVSIISLLVFTLLGLTGSRFYYAIQTDIQPIINYGRDYLLIVCGCCVGLFVQITMDRILQSTGRTVLTMFTQILGAGINIILDPILIFGLFGFPRLEVAGAAIATVIGQIMAACLSIFFNWKLNPDVHFQFKGFRPDGGIIKGIYSVGVPSIIMGSIGSVMTFGMNQILLAFTATATAVFGIYFKLQSFIFMPVFGLNNGMVPIVAYNYGARKPSRITATIKLSICYAVGIMVVGLLIFQFFPDMLIGMFMAEDGSSADLLTIGVPALRIISISFPFAGFCIVCGSVLQALGHGFLSMLVSVVRQLCVLLPAAFILSRLLDLHAVWWSFPIAEIFSLALSTLFLSHVFHKEIKPLY